ncbi:hypothetical protein MPSEU_000018200 [Mayamaea pseudoterrestris]|nr:hypothetical protein MPSEU_000018200 [Mayamaea pseudoterrestris]
MHPKSQQQLNAVHDAIGAAWQQFHVELAKNEMLQQQRLQCNEQKQQQATNCMTAIMQNMPSQVGIAPLSIRHAAAANYQLQMPEPCYMLAPAILHETIRPLPRPEYESDNSRHEEVHVEDDATTMVMIDPETISEILCDFQRKPRRS